MRLFGGRINLLIPHAVLLWTKVRGSALLHHKQWRMRPSLTDLYPLAQNFLLGKDEFAQLSRLAYWLGFGTFCGPFSRCLEQSLQRTAVCGTWLAQDQHSQEINLKSSVTQQLDCQIMRILQNSMERRLPYSVVRNSHNSFSRICDGLSTRAEPCKAAGFQLLYATV